MGGINAAGQGGQAASSGTQLQGVRLLYFSICSVPHYHNFLEESWLTGSLCLSTGTVLSPMLWDGELMFHVPRLHKFICYFSRASFFSFLLCYFKELMRILVLQDKKGPFFTSSTKWQPFWLQDFQTLVCSGKWHMAVVALLLADTVKNQKTLKGFISVMRMGREPF